MQVWLNDIACELPEALPLRDALIEWQYINMTFAVAINHVFIPQHQHAHTLINAGDRIDIVTPMQGG